jgi:hypothetical protein
MTKKWLALPLLLATTLPGLAQYGDRYDRHRDHGQFYGGVRDGGRNGDYYGNDRRYGNGYDDRYRQRQGGIGPGKGALIGGAGGAALGAIFGGGVKGALIGGAAGAGIGAIVGKEHQDNRRDRY